MISLPSIGAYIDESWSLYKKHFTSYARITFWYAITAALAIIGSFLSPTYGNLPFVDNLTATYTTPAAIAGLIVSTVNILIILPIITLWISVGLIKFMKRTYEGQADTAEAMSDAGRVLLPAIGITILLTFMFVALFLIPWIPGMIFIILGLQNGGLPGVIGIVLLVLGILTGMALLAYYSVRYSFALYEVVVGNATITSSLSRSYDITDGKFWTIFWRWIVSAVVLLAIGVTLNLFTYYGGKAFVDLFLFNLTLFERVSVALDLVLSLVVFMVMTPLSTAFGYVLYRHIAKK